MNTDANGAVGKPSIAISPSPPIALNAIGVGWGDTMNHVCHMCGQPATDRINIPGHGYREYCYEHAQAIVEQAAANGMGLGIGQ